MTLFRQSRGGMKSTRKTSPAIGTNDTGVTDQTASTSSEQPNGTSTYYIPARGHSSSSTSSVDSGSSSAAGASSMNACAINGPIGLQGVMNTAHHQAATRAHPSSSTESLPPNSQPSHIFHPNSSLRPQLIEPAPLEAVIDSALPQLSRFGRILPSTLELRAQGATLPCLAYGTPRPPMASEDYGSPPPYETIFGRPQTHDAVFGTSNRQSTTA